MKISLNGKSIDTKSRTLLDLVTDQGLETGSLVVEHNFEVIRQEVWKKALIQAGDTIELLSFVGGG